MGKNKSKQAQPQLLSPEKYIKTKVRNLPVYECVISKEWKERGIAQIMVTRQHAGGNFTCGIYIVDTFCLGVKETAYRFNMTPLDYEEFKELLTGEEPFDAVDYNTVHNIVYGAVAFAEEYGFNPHKEFALTQFILDEDSEDVPLIEYEFGKDGEPFLIVRDKQEASKYLPTLRKFTGDDPKYLILDGDMEWLKDDENLLDYPEIPYTYQHPDYPTELKLIHPELTRLLMPFKYFLLSSEEIDTILALPRESLIVDLQHIILFVLGQEQYVTVEKEEDTWIPADSSLTHALFFLGELKAEEALDTVLEVMRQSFAFMDLILEDTSEDILPLTLYYVGRNKLTQLMAYAKEPGLSPEFKSFVFSAVNYIVNEPGRRTEVLDWYREIIGFYIEHCDDISLFSANLGGLLIYEILNIRPQELIPEIKELFDATEIDTIFCGDYQDVMSQLLSDDTPVSDFALMDIYERNQTFCEEWSFLMDEE